MIPPRRNGLYIGRYFGIEFYLHYSWFFIAAIITYELATEFFPSEFRGPTPLSDDQSVLVMRVPK